jgi:hypothetical protein
LVSIDPEQRGYRYIELNSEKERNEVQHLKNESSVSVGFIIKFEDPLFQIMLSTFI